MNAYAYSYVYIGIRGQFQNSNHIDEGSRVGEWSEEGSVLTIAAIGSW